MTKIILIEAVRNLGEVGEVVNVRNGYARNYLLPKRMAMRATQPNIDLFEARRSEFEKAAEEHLQRCYKAALNLSQATLHIVTPSNASGVLFGSITPKVIAKEAERLGFVIPAADVRISEPIRRIGVYKIGIQLHSKISASIHLLVSSSPNSYQEIPIKWREDGGNKQDALHILDMLAASFTNRMVDDASRELLRVVKLIDDSLGNRAEIAMENESGSEFHNIVISALEKINVNCLISLNAHNENNNLNIVKFTARAISAIPVKVGDLRQIILGSHFALSTADFELSLYSPMNVETGKAVHSIEKGKHVVEALTIEQTVTIPPWKIDVGSSAEIWAMISLNGECVHRRVWRFSQIQRRESEII